MDQWNSVGGTVLWNSVMEQGWWNSDGRTVRWNSGTGLVEQ